MFTASKAHSVEKPALSKLIVTKNTIYRNYIGQNIKYMDARRFCSPKTGEGLDGSQKGRIEFFQSAGNAPDEREELKINESRKDMN